MPVTLLSENLIPAHSPPTKKNKKTADGIKSMYKLFIEEKEAALRGDWVRVGNLRVRLEVSRTLKIEIVD